MKISDVVWPDSEMLSIAADYDCASVTVQESSGRVITVKCLGYIGYAVMGYWDEIVIEKATMSRDHPFVTDCLAELDHRLGTNPPKSGCHHRSTEPEDYMALNIVLIDGCQATLVGTEFVVIDDGKKLAD